jgi:hypothetical protein
MRPMLRRVAISLSAEAISRAWARDSSTQGPAMTVSGSALPMRTLRVSTTEFGSITGLSVLRWSLSEVLSVDWRAQVKDKNL